MSVEEFGGGVLAGVIAIVVWEAGRRWWRHHKLHRDFGHLAGGYKVARKLTGKRESGIAKVKVVGSQLQVTFIDLPAGEAITGEIGMNEAMPLSGRGQYHHVTPRGDLWGFWDVQVAPPNTLLVHTTYAQTPEIQPPGNEKRHTYAVVSGFVWTHIASQ